jgi:hypothetical protein
MTKFKVQKIECGSEGNLYPFQCNLCGIKFTQIYWYYIVECGWFHSEECTEMYILKEMG